MSFARDISKRKFLGHALAASACLGAIATRASAQEPAPPLVLQTLPPAPPPPEPKPQPTPLKPGLRRAFVPFATSPFPYEGIVPHTGKPFLDTIVEGRSGRQSARTNDIYWADQTYSDRTVLIDIAPGFSTARPGVLIVYLHGNGATLERDVIKRQRVPQQVAAAGLNSVLIAPQLAFDALDSSAGMFWQQGAFSAFLDEAGAAVARMTGARSARRYVRQLPIILIAYSGGYHPLAYIVHHAGHERIIGAVLLDALYGDVDKIGEWVRTTDTGFFVSAFTKSSLDRNIELQHRLFAEGFANDSMLPTRLAARDRIFMHLSPPIEHQSFVSKAWIDHPIRDLLGRVDGYPRPTPR